MVERITKCDSCKQDADYDECEPVRFDDEPEIKVVCFKCYDRMKNG